MGALWAKLLQSCLTFCKPMVYRLPGPSVQRIILDYGIIQARIQGWIVMLSSRGSSILKVSLTIQRIGEKFSKSLQFRGSKKLALTLQIFPPANLIFRKESKPCRQGSKKTDWHGKKLMFYRLFLIVPTKLSFGMTKRAPSWSFQCRFSFNSQLNKHLQAYIYSAGIPTGGCPFGSYLAFEAQFPVINLTP